MVLYFQERERDHFSQFITEGFTSYCKRKRRDKVCDSIVGRSYFCCFKEKLAVIGILGLCLDMITLFLSLFICYWLCGTLWWNWSVFIFNIFLANYFLNCLEFYTITIKAACLSIMWMWICLIEELEKKNLALPDNIFIIKGILIILILILI